MTSFDGKKLHQRANKKVQEAKTQIERVRSNSVSKVEAAIEWVYRNVGGEEWDAQPACIITDYILAIQCFLCGVYLLYTTEFFNAHWYVTYFFAMGTTAAVGGFLHHVALKAMKVFLDDPERTARVFGVYVKRSTVDCVIDCSWRVVLGFTTLTNFCLVAFASTRNLEQASADLTIYIAASGYALLGALAFVKMNTAFMMAGFVPAMVFGTITSTMALNKGWLHELVLLGLKLASGLIQGLMVSPSSKHFNHNALSHVMLSAAAATMMIHFHVTL